MKRILVKSVSAFALVSFLTIEFGERFFNVTAILLLLALLIISICRAVFKKSVFTALICIIVFALAGLYKTSLYDVKTISAAERLDGAYVICEGDVKSAKKGDDYIVMTVATDLVNEEKKNINVSVISKDEKGNIDVGTRVSFEGTLEFNANSYGKGNATFLSTFANKVTVEKQTNKILSLLANLRARISENSEKSKSSGLVKAFVIGDKSEIPSEVASSFKRLGTSHLLAISGLHLSIIAMSLYLFLMKIGAGRYISVALSSFVALFYIFITGFSISVVRAGGMMILYLISRLSRRINDSITSLFSACFIILLISPWSIYDLSLQLSFCATLGILVFLPPATLWLDEVISKWQRRKSIVFKSLTRICEYTIVSVYSTLSATLFTLPIVLVIFNEVSLISPLANLFVIFFAKYFIMFSFLGVTLSFLPIQFLSTCVFFVGDLIAKCMLFIVSALSVIAPDGLSMDLGFLTLGVLLVIILILPTPFFSRKILTVPVSSAVITAFIFLFNFIVYKTTYDDIRISAVWNRDCKSEIVICSGESYLIDQTATNSTSVSSIMALANERKIEKFDKLVIVADEIYPEKRVEALIRIFEVDNIVLLLPSDFEKDFYEIYEVARERNLRLEVLFVDEYSVTKGVRVSRIPDACTAVEVEKSRNSVTFYHETSDEDSAINLFKSDVIFLDGTYLPLDNDGKIYKTGDLKISHWRLSDEKIHNE